MLLIGMQLGKLGQIKIRLSNDITADMTISVRPIYVVL